MSQDNQNIQNTIAADNKKETRRNVLAAAGLGFFTTGWAAFIGGTLLRETFYKRAFNNIGSVYNCCLDLLCGSIEYGSTVNCYASVVSVDLIFMCVEQLNDKAAQALCEAALNYSVAKVALPAIAGIAVAGGVASGAIAYKCSARNQASIENSDEELGSPNETSASVPKR